MLRNLLLLITAIFFLHTSGFSQACQPDPQYTKNGVFPDSAKNFDTAYVAVPYTQLVTIIVPKDTQAFPPPFPKLNWDSTRLDSVSGLPPTLSYACWNNNGSGSSSRCEWKGNTKGCAIITGTPVIADTGTHMLKFYTSNFVGGQTSANGYTISYYKIVVMPAVNAVNEYIGIQNVRQNNPNPFSDKSEIIFTAEENGITKFKIYNLVGNVIEQFDVKAKKGINKIELNARDFDDGIYFYSIVNGCNSYTRKMIVKK